MTAEEHLELAKENLGRLIENMARMGMPHGGFVEVMDSLEKIDLTDTQNSKQAYEAGYINGYNDILGLDTYEKWKKFK